MKTLLICIALAACAFFAPLKSFDPAARVLVPAIALMAAGIFPCMSLAVGAMKGEHRTPALVEELYERLKLLLKVLVASFGLAVMAIILLACTVIVAANALPSGGSADIPPQYLGWIARSTASLSVIAIGLLGGRVVAVGKAFFAILDINRKHALLIARAALRKERDGWIMETKSIKLPDDDPTPRPLQRVS